jgi:hypothetical protein
MPEKFIEEQIDLEAYIDEKGREVLSRKKIEVPVDFKVPETLNETVRRMIQGELSNAADRHGMETFEESEDFDIEDPEMEDIDTPFEQFFDPVLNEHVSGDMLERNPDYYRQRYTEAAADNPELEEQARKEASRRSFFERFRDTHRAGKKQQKVEKPDSTPDDKNE